MSHFQYCTTEKDKPLLMWGEDWPGMDVLAVVTYECDIKPVSPFVEELDKAQKKSRGKQRPK